MRYLTVTPAYGRDYRSKKEVQAAWDRGEDFQSQDFQFSGYLNNRDKVDEDIVLMARYNKLQKIVEIVR